MVKRLINDDFLPKNEELLYAVRFGKGEKWDRQTDMADLNIILENSAIFFLKKETKSN